MSTVIRNLGNVRIPYSSRLFKPRLIEVERAGFPAESVWRNKNPLRPFITTIGDAVAHVGSGWGREALVAGDDDPMNEPIFWSNDCQRISWLCDVLAEGRRVHLAMMFADLADTDETGGDIWVNGAHVHIPFQPNGSINTIAIDTTDDVLKFTVDVGHGKARVPGARADGWTARLPCALRQAA